MKVDTGEINLYVETEGNGIPLVLIEGLGYSSWMWHFQKPLSSELKLVIYDNRGVGFSDKPIEPYSMENFVADLHSVVDYLNLDHFFLLGVSMGGMIAQEFAFRYRRLLVGLILSSTNFGIRSVLPSREILTLLGTPPGNMTMEERMAPAFSPKTLESKKDFVDFVVQLRMSQETKVMQLQQINATAGFDSLDGLKTLELPTLIISGLDDKIVPRENSERMHEMIPNSELVLFKDAGHLVNIERAEDYNDTIMDFVSRVHSNRFNPDKTIRVK